MVRLCLYEEQKEKSMSMEILCEDRVSNHIDGLRDKHKEVAFRYCTERNLLKFSAFEKFSSLKLYNAAMDVYEIALEIDRGISFIDMVLDDRKLVKEGELLGATLTFTEDSVLQIQGKREETMKAFSRIFHRIRRKIFRKHVDFSQTDIEEEKIDRVSVKIMINGFKIGRKLESWYAYQIVMQTKRLLSSLPSLVNIDVPNGSHITVCGDLHGQFFDLINIFELNGVPSEENPYLFNGDFVDRGEFSVETILTLFAFKCMCPKGIYLGRGNHESRSLNEIYGFKKEVKYKMRKQFVKLFAETFCTLPLAHVINEKIIVVHGGLFSKEGVTLWDIKAIDRFCEPPHEGYMCELLWSDPHPKPGRRMSKRGIAIEFGGDVTDRFLKNNNLDLLVRSHEMKDEGYEIHHDGKLITVFSAPNYCNQFGNQGAYIRFEAPALKPDIHQFDAVHYPVAKTVAKKR